MATGAAGTKKAKAKLPRSTDVLIVGAGPTGLSLALALRRAGVDCCIIDGTTDLGADPRASLLHVRTIELLAGLGLGDRLSAAGSPIERAAYYDAGLRVSELDFSTLNSSVSNALGISQGVVEALLVDELESMDCDVKRPASLEEFEASEEGISALIGRRGMRRTRVAARFIVGCDGAVSTVRDQSGLTDTGYEIADAFATATVELAGEVDRDTLHFFAANDGFLVLSPLPKNRWRLTATTAHSESKPTAEQLQLLLADRGPRASSITLGRPTDVGRYRVRQAVARRLREGRVLLAGDAAHTFSPAGGQGMNCGIADAVNLGWKLAAVCKGEAGSGLLETYDDERRPMASALAGRTERFGEALAVRNPVARALRDGVALLAGRVGAIGEPVLRGLAGFDTTYESGAVQVGGGGVGGWGSVGERSELVEPYLLADQAHHLLVSHVGDADRFREAAHDYAAPIVIDSVDARAAGACLVRPDGHIGWCGTDVVGLQRHLDRWFKRSA